MSDNMDSLRLLSASAAVVGLILSVMRLVEEIRKFLAIVGLGQEKHPDVFYEIWFWGFITAAAGGFIWGLVWKKAVGGDYAEPHRMWAVLWPLITLFPAFLGLAFLNFKYHLVPWREQALSHSAWLLGAVLGSAAFYDLPLAGFRGFRDLLLAKSPGAAEFWLVLIWSALASFPAFLCMAVFRWWRLRIPVTFDEIWLAVVKPVGLVMIVTSLAVFAFLFAYPDRLKFEQARGVVAALFLRITLFISLFLASQAGVSSTMNL